MFLVEKLSRIARVRVIGRVIIAITTAVDSKIIVLLSIKVLRLTVIQGCRGSKAVQWWEQFKIDTVLREMTALVLLLPHGLPDHGRCLKGGSYLTFLASLDAHGVHHQPAAYGHVSRVPTVEVLPDTVRHNLVVKVLNYCPLDLIQISDLSLEQVFVLDAIWTLIEQLRLLIVILDRFLQRCE